MKKQKNAKTPRVFSESTPPPIQMKERLEAHGSFKVGDTVFFNSVLVGTKYHRGTLKEIVVQSESVIIFDIWDEDKGMWRMLLPENVFSQRPQTSRRRG
jgi:hypothetical protein